MDQLLASSDATRSKFLDLQFLRNRRVKSSAHRSRPWYTTVEQWLEGTRAEQADPGLSFFEEVILTCIDQYYGVTVRVVTLITLFSLTGN